MVNKNKNPKQDFFEKEKSLNDELEVSLFFWNSSLTPERRQEILNWFNSNSAIERDYIRDLMSDARDEARFDMED